MASVHPMSLEGRTVVITGAAQGIGRGVADLAAALGARVALVDIKRDAVAQAAADIGAKRARAYVGDVCDPKFVDTMVAAVIADFGHIDGLVNNAGIARPAFLETMSKNQWDQVIAVNLSGVFLCLQAVGRHMIDKAKAGDPAPGRIVNHASDAGLRGTFGQVNYGAAKSAVLGITMCAAREWGRYGIAVNSACFGLVETEMSAVIRKPHHLARHLPHIPLGRMSTPDEIAKPVCFLLSDAASYITGQHLAINGGIQVGI